MHRKFNINRSDWFIDLSVGLVIREPINEHALVVVGCSWDAMPWVVPILNALIYSAAVD